MIWRKHTTIIINIVVNRKIIFSFFLVNIDVRWLYMTLHQSKIIYIYTEIRIGFHQNPLPSGKVLTSKDYFDFLMILKAPLISALIIAPDPVLNKPRLERLPL